MESEGSSENYLGWWVLVQKQETQVQSAHWPKSFQCLYKVWGCIWGVTGKGHSWVILGTKGTVLKGSGAE